MYEDDGKNGNLVEVDLLDVLLDPDNKAPLYMRDGNGRQLAFEQVAVIPRGSELYCILKPLDRLAGVADDEAIVFRVAKDGGKDILVVEDDEEAAIAVFDEYAKMFDEADGKRRRRRKRRKKD